MQNTQTIIERTLLTPFETLDDGLRNLPREETREDAREEDGKIDPITPADPDPQEGQATVKEELEYDVQITGNPIKIIAQDWKAKGHLPEDLEVADNITAEELEDLFRNHKEKLIKEEIRTSVLDELRDQGVDSEIIETARLIKYGVPKEQISQAEAYNVLGSVQLDPNDDSYEGYARQVLFQFYADKGFAADKIDRYVERDIEAEDVESLVSDAQQYFLQKAIEYKQYFKQVESQQIQQQRQQAEQTVSTMNQFLDKGEIAGRKYSKEQMAQVKKALFDKTEVITDAQGNRRRVTPYEKKRMEYQSNFELNLKSVVDFILGYDAKASEDEGRLKGKSDALRELNKAVEVTIKGVREVNKDNIERREIA